MGEYAEEIKYEKGLGNTDVCSWKKKKNKRK